MTALTPKQQAIRRERVTASTMAAFLGYSPYSSPLEAWKVHMGYQEFVPNEDTEGGQDFEEAIVQAGERLKIPEWEYRLRPRSLQLSANPDDDTLIDPFHPWLCATPDFVADPFHTAGDWAIQVKNHRPHMTKAYKGNPSGGWDNELVPKHILIQCQTEMIVLSGFTGRPQLQVYLCCHFGGPTPRVYRIRRDEGLQAGLLKAGLAFWAAHINYPAPPNDVPWLVGPEPKAKKREKITGDFLLAAPLPEFSAAPASELLRNQLPSFGERDD